MSQTNVEAAYWKSTNSLGGHHRCYCAAGQGVALQGVEQCCFPALHGTAQQYFLLFQTSLKAL